MLRAIALLTLGSILLGVSCNFSPDSPSPSLSSSPPLQQPLLNSPPPPKSTSMTTSTTSRLAPSTTALPEAKQLKIRTNPASLPTPIQDIYTPSFAPIIGNADKIAFINQGEIWMANLDGSGLIQLTDDNLPKTSIQWSPDNNGVIYLTDGCANYVDTYSLQISVLVCFDQAERFESFQISPDGGQVAISLDGQLYVVPFDKVESGQVRSSFDLIQIARCENLAPYKHRQSMVTVTKARWSADGTRLAILRKAFDADRQVELIHLLDITHCQSPLPRLDEFPASRFTMEDYTQNPLIQDFAWDGNDLFALTSYQRNDGFGDLWIYNANLHRGFKANPIDGKCCYRDPVFSPDGKYLAFVFQDARLAPNGPAVLYYVPHATLDSSLVYPPLPFPPEFFSDRRAKPQPILRPAR